MNKVKYLLVAAMVIGAIGICQAEEAGAELGVVLDATYVSKYIWRGIDILDDVGAFQPSVDIDLYGTGFSLNFWASYAGSAGNTSGGSSRVNLTEYDYTLRYSTTLFEGQSYKADTTVNYIYYDFPDEPSKMRDAQEIGVGFVFPDMCPTGFVPSYYVGKIWESKSDSTALTGNYSGWLHVFGLGYDISMPAVMPETVEQIVSLNVAAVYNDGFASGAVDHEWTHAVFSASTSFDLADNLTFTPGIYYQSSWEDTINTSDEF